MNRRLMETLATVEHSHDQSLGRGRALALTENDSSGLPLPKRPSWISALGVLIAAAIVASPAHAQNSEYLICSNVPSTDVSLSNTDNARLDQNAPNPFTHETTITYKLPSNAKSVRMIFHDSQSRVVKVVALTSDDLDKHSSCAGLGRVIVFGDDLSSGQYTYDLMVDGRLLASREMVKTR